MGGCDAFLVRRRYASLVPGGCGSCLLGCLFVIRGRVPFLVAVVWLCSGFASRRFEVAALTVKSMSM